jgi:hypothetical protein
MKEVYIQSIYNQYLGKRDEARADLEICLTNLTISDVGAEIHIKLKTIAKYDSLLATMEKVFGRPPAPPKEDS